MEYEQLPFVAGRIRLAFSPKFPNLQEEFEDSKGVIRIRISKNRQHNGQKKVGKRTNNDLQNIHIKPNIE